MSRGKTTTVDEHCGDVCRKIRPQSLREMNATEDRNLGDEGAENTGTGKHRRKKMSAQGYEQEIRGFRGQRRGRNGRLGRAVWGRWDTVTRRHSVTRRGNGDGGGGGRTGTRGSGDTMLPLPYSMVSSHETWGVMAWQQRWHIALRLAASLRLEVDGSPASCG